MIYLVMKRKTLQLRILYPARLSLKFDGEIKSFPDKQKLREFSINKPALTIAKGAALGRKPKKRKRPTENKHKTIKKMVTGSCALLCLVAQSCPTLCDCMDCSLPGSSVHGESPGKNTGVGCYALLQGIFPIQGLNPGFQYCRLFII